MEAHSREGEQQIQNRRNGTNPEGLRMAKAFGMART